MRPIPTDNPKEEKKETQKSISIVDMLVDECSKCFYESSCPQARKDSTCSLVESQKIRLSSSKDIQVLQEGIVEDAVDNLKKQEALFRIGFIDDADGLASLRKSTFELLEKLKKTAFETPTSKTVSDVLGLKLDAT